MASGALRVLLGSHGVDKAEAVDQTLAGFTELPAHPDVSPGLHRIHAAGIRLVTLTNGATAISDRMLTRPACSRCLSTASRWRCRSGGSRIPTPTAMPPKSAASNGGAMALVAAHPWDVDRAHRAGLTGVWVHLRKTQYPLAFQPPDLQVPNLETLADMLTAS